MQSAEASTNGNLAGSTVRVSNAGPGAGGATYDSKTETQDIIRFDNNKDDIDGNLGR